MIQIDMPMPKNCLDCPACNEYLTCAIPVNGRKWGENDVREYGNGRPEWCPLKEQEVSEELKLKIWNALYIKEDEYEKKLIEADKCHEWFSIYRPWLQIGFNIAIDAIAEWEGR